jgi:hypothetical protein
MPEPELNRSFLRRNEPRFENVRSLYTIGLVKYLIIDLAYHHLCERTSGRKKYYNNLNAQRITSIKEPAFDDTEMKG